MNTITNEDYELDRVFYRMRNLAPSIFLLMIVPIALSIVRLSLAETDSYIYLNWNLFLGLLPIFFAWLFYKGFGGIGGKVVWFIAWLGFLPNAPYLITDLIHLAEVGPRSLIWFDSLMLFGYAWIGMLIWLVSMYVMYQKVRSVIFVPTVSLLTAIGVFVGRYVRHNSWDIVLHPRSVLDTFVSFLSSPLDHEPLLAFVGVFWLFFMFSYLGYSSFHEWKGTHQQETEKEN